MPKMSLPTTTWPPCENSTRPTEESAVEAGASAARTADTAKKMTAVEGGAWTETASYTFVGEDPIGSGPFLVGVHIGDPNLATLPQIAPLTTRVNCRTGMVVIFK